MVKRQGIVLPANTSTNQFSFLEGYKGDSPVTIKFQEKRHWYYIRGSGLLIPDDNKFHYCPNVTTIAGKLDKSYSLLPWAKKLVGTTYSKNLWKLFRALSKIEDDVNLPRNAKADACKVIIMLLKNEIKIIETLAIDEPERIRLAATDIGIAFHKWYENYVLYCMGKNKSEPIWEGKKTLNKSCMRIKHFIDVNVDKFLGAEQKIYSKKYNYIGTLDNIYISKHDGAKVIGDLKVTSGVYESTRLQAAAYVNADREMTGKEAERRVITVVDKTTGGINFVNLETQFKTTIEQDFRAFLGLRYAYMWQKEA